MIFATNSKSKATKSLANITMAGEAAAPAAAAQGQDKQQGPGLLSRIMNMMIMYWIVTTGFSFITGKLNGGYSTSPGASSTTMVGTGAGGGDVVASTAADTYPTKYYPSVRENAIFKMTVELEAKYLVVEEGEGEVPMLSEGSSSEDAKEDISKKKAKIAADETGDLVSTTSDEDEKKDVVSAAAEEKWLPVPGFSAPSITLNSLYFHNDHPEETQTVFFNASACIERNCTIFANVEYQMVGDRTIRVNYSTPLVHFFTEKVKQLRNLFEDDVPEPLAENNKTLTRAFYQPSVTVCPVVDFTKWQEPGIPPQMKEFLHLIPSTIVLRELEDNKPPLREGKYYPIVYDNNFWTLKSHMIELNETTDAMLNVTVSHYPLNLWKFMLYSQMEQAFNMHEQTGMVGKGERDETKRIFMETNPYFLGMTMVVSMLHLVFEYLAFSNDVSFWKGKKDFRGLSLRTVAMNCYFQTIIFLYLLDSDVTSWTVWAPSGVGVLIEYWKLRKVIKVIRVEGVADTAPVWKKYRLEFESSYDSKTKSYDQQAMKYLTYILVPGIIGYSIYSAYTHTYKGWYSFFIATQVRFIYFSGFIMMTPQIFINYKLKSVAALPWRTFVYKALNTFIDDMFAFIITMPTMHRLACFRDDIIFFIILYQRWIYPVDRTRTESGALIEDEEESKKEEGAAAAIEEKKDGDDSKEKKE